MGRSGCMQLKAKTVHSDAPASACVCAAAASTSISCRMQLQGRCRFSKKWLSTEDGPQHLSEWALKDITFLTTFFFMNVKWLLYQSILWGLCRLLSRKRVRKQRSETASNDCGRFILVTYFYAFIISYPLFLQRKGVPSKNWLRIDYIWNDCDVNLAQELFVILLYPSPVNKLVLWFNKAVDELLASVLDAE